MLSASLEYKANPCTAQGRSHNEELPSLADQQGLRDTAGKSWQTYVQTARKATLDHVPLWGMYEATEQVGENTSFLSRILVCQETSIYQLRILPTPISQNI